MHRSKPREYLGPYFEILPQELILLVLSHLYIEELPSALLLNRYFSQLAEQAWLQKFPHHKDHLSKGGSAKNELIRFIKARIKSAGWITSESYRLQDKKNRINLFLACYQNRVNDVAVDVAPAKAEIQQPQKLQNVKQAFNSFITFEKSEMTGGNEDYRQAITTGFFSMDFIKGLFDISYFSPKACGQLYELLLSKTTRSAYIVEQAALFGQPVAVLSQQQEQGLDMDVLRHDPVYRYSLDQINMLIKYGRINWLTVFLNENVISEQQVIECLLKTREFQLRSDAKPEEDAYKFLVDWFFANPSPELKARLPSLFIEAAQKSNLAVLKALHQYQKDLEVKNEKGETPLKAACEGLNCRNALYLLQQGAKLCEELSLLFSQAIYQLNLDDYIQATRFIPEERKKTYLNSALWCAAKSKRAQMVKWLLDNGANPNVPDNRNELLYYDVMTTAVKTGGKKGKKLTDFFEQHLSKRILLCEETMELNKFINYLSEYHDHDGLPDDKDEAIYGMTEYLFGVLRDFEKILKQSNDPTKRREAYNQLSRNVASILQGTVFTDVLYTHRQEWKPIALNIFLAVITCGIWALVSAAKVVYSIYTEPKHEHPTFTHLLFFGKTATQYKMAAIEEEVNRLGRRLAG